MHKGLRLLARIGRINEVGILVALLLLAFTLRLTTEAFMTQLNLINVARQASYYGIMGVGMVFVLVMGDVDLSVGSILTLANVVTAIALREKYPLPIAVGAGLLTGALCGFLNGLLCIVLRVPMIIITLGTLSVYRGLALMACNATPISQFSKDNFLFNVGGGNIGGIPSSVLVMVGLGLLGWIGLTRTVVGRRTQVIGSNPQTARLAGIAINRYRIGVMTLNGLIAALAGILALAFLTAADPSTGPGFELWVIASAIIGGTALSGGSGSVPGAILGALLIAVIRNGLVLLGFSAYSSTAVTGAVIILAVALDALIKRRASLR